ncbi:MAG: hypothetical protein LC808_32110 [Actinobacteria bacterium]|nr:hypothetical protein [Actinomycetota bacterium]
MPEIDPPHVYVALVPVLDTTRPDFRAAAWRVVESGERFRQLQERMPELSEEWKGYPAVRAPKSAPTELQLSLKHWKWSQMTSARALTFLASEVLHHARIALDYCAYHVVWLDGGKPRDDTKFPLVEDSSRWGKEKRNGLPGITPEHAKWIREIQPFAGVEWTRKLAELSNRDKHRMAVEVNPVYRCRVDRSKLYSDPLDDPDFWGFAVDEAHLELTIAPAMSQNPGEAVGLPLEPTLVEIVRGVTDLVNRFLIEAGYNPISLHSGNSDGPEGHDEPPQEPRKSSR